jgi:hypothetical protein
VSLASARATLAIVLLAVFACGAPRILGFGEAADTTLVVRHSFETSLVVFLDQEPLGEVPPNETACFQVTRTGSVRLEARSPDSDRLRRATSAVFTSERAFLWDIDQNEILDGRAHAGLCRSTSHRLTAGDAPV